MLTTLVIGATCLLIVLCRLNHRVKYYVKFTLYMTFTFLYSLIFVPLMIPLGRDSRNGLLPAWAIRNTMRALLGVDYDIRGMENILSKGQGCVLLMNHQSSLDVLVFTHIWRYIPEGSTIARREVFWILPFPWFWNTVYINRLNPNQARNDINEVGKLISTKHTRICMFPEGTRHSGATLLPFKKGAFHVALSAQCPVQPVVVSKYHFLDHQDKRFDSGRAVVEFLPAIQTKGKTLDEVMEESRDVMQRSFTRLSEETAPKPINR